MIERFTDDWAIGQLEDSNPAIARLLNCRIDCANASIAESSVSRSIINHHSQMDTISISFAAEATRPEAMTPS
jgi:hypothetical protein